MLDIIVTPAVFYRFGRKPMERLLAAHNATKNKESEQL